jgi:hypothetical protein
VVWIGRVGSGRFGECEVVYTGVVKEGVEELPGRGDV